ncbi:hypothetical protein BGZ73_001122, partial [Actinomortierella ambigua]
ELVTASWRRNSGKALHRKDKGMYNTIFTMLSDTTVINYPWIVFSKSEGKPNNSLQHASDSDHSNASDDDESNGGDELDSSSTGSNGIGGARRKGDAKNKSKSTDPNAYKGPMHDHAIRHYSRRVNWAKPWARHLLSDTGAETTHRSPRRSCI